MQFQPFLSSFSLRMVVSLALVSTISSFVPPNIELSSSPTNIPTPDVPAPIWRFPTGPPRLEPDWDPTMLAMPLELPDHLLHPYVRRDDFQFMGDVIDRYIPDLQRGYYTGPGLPHIDPLQRPGPMATKDGPIPDSGSPWLTKLRDPPKIPMRLFGDGVDNPADPDYGDFGRFFYETMQYGDMGMREADQHKDLPYPFDDVAQPPIDLMQSHQLRAMASETDRMLIHPDDPLPAPYSAEPLAPPPLSSAMASHEGVVFNPESNFGADAHQIQIEVAADPSTMQYNRVLGEEAARERRVTGHGLGAGVAATVDPRTDATLQPILTGGVCIGIRCSDGVVLAADTMVCYGSFKMFTDARRLHKISDQIIMVADGEYSDFQQLQSMFQELIEEHHYIPPVGTHQVRPRQAYEFLARVMYERRSQMDPLWNTVMLGGWGKPCGEAYPEHLDHRFEEEPFLGTVDMQGTPLESHILATGIGNYMALPLLRQATQEAQRMKEDLLPLTLNTTQAIDLACDTMRVLALRSARCSNRIQIGMVTAEGAELSAPFRVEGNWTFEGFHKREEPLTFQPRGPIWPF